MRRINRNSIEFQNFKKMVERNKLKSNGTSIDLMVSYLKRNNIKFSNMNQCHN